MATDDGQFDDQALLVSRTDERGVILYANSGFENVSGYPESELLSAPHKIVRHPDMPKGVFWYVWDRLGKGQPVSAYVKNRTKSGGSYWVLATFTPVEGGHMSMRIAVPNTDLSTIEALYETMCKQETDGELTPEQSAQHMLDWMPAQGFADETSFGASCLYDQLVKRAPQTKQSSDPRLDMLQRVLKTWNCVSVDCEKIFDAYLAFGKAPENMQIQAGHLDEGGAALGVIALNFAGIADAIHGELQRFSQNVQVVRKTISEALFLVSVQSLLSETENALRLEEHTDETDLQIITDQRNLYEQRTADAVDIVISKLSLFFRFAEVVKRHLSGLSMTRVMCAIENAQVSGGQKGSIGAIIEDLRLFQETADKSMREIESQLSVIDKEVGQLQRQAA